MTFLFPSSGTSSIVNSYCRYEAPLTNKCERPDKPTSPKSDSGSYHFFLWRGAGPLHVTQIHSSKGADDHYNMDLL
jgi:hypothetical protein